MFKQISKLPISKKISVIHESMKVLSHKNFIAVLEEKDFVIEVINEIEQAENSTIDLLSSFKADKYIITLGKLLNKIIKEEFNIKKDLGRSLLINLRRESHQKFNHFFKENHATSKQIQYGTQGERKLKRIDKEVETRIFEKTFASLLMSISSPLGLSPTIQKPSSDKRIKHLLRTLDSNFILCPMLMNKNSPIDKSELIAFYRAYTKKEDETYSNRIRSLKKLSIIESNKIKGSKTQFYTIKPSFVKYIRETTQGVKFHIDSIKILLRWVDIYQLQSKSLWESYNQENLCKLLVNSNLTGDNHQLNYFIRIRNDILSNISVHLTGQYIGGIKSGLVEEVDFYDMLLNSALNYSSLFICKEWEKEKKSIRIKDWKLKKPVWEKIILETIRNPVTIFIDNSKFILFFIFKDPKYLHE